MNQGPKHRLSYRTHLASFNGIHNASKTKTLIILDHYKYKLKSNTGLNVRQLHLESGVNYNYLRSRLGKWFKWKYVSRRAHDDGSGRPMFYYTIADRGEHFINHVVPNDVRTRYINELNQYRTNKRTHKRSPTPRT